jgi:hypothetical protein
MKGANFIDVGCVRRYLIPDEQAKLADRAEAGVIFMRLDPAARADEWHALLNGVLVPAEQFGHAVRVPQLIGPFPDFALAQAEADLTLICKALGIT